MFGLRKVEMSSFPLSGRKEDGATHEPKERERIRVLEDVVSGRLRQGQAADFLG